MIRHVSRPGALLVAGVLAASVPALAAAQEPVTITFYGDTTDAQSPEWWQSIFDRFEAQEPGIDVQLISPPSPGERDTYAKTLIASGDFPDVSQNLTLNTFKEVLQPFDQSDPDYAQIIDPTYQMIGDELYGLGVGRQVLSAQYYNKDLFAQAGITELPSTWPEYEEVLAKLHAAGIQPLQMGGEWYPGFSFLLLTDLYIESPCWQAGRWTGDVHFTDPNWVAAAEMFRGWVEKGYFGASPLGLGFDEATQAFKDGASAIWGGGSSFPASLRDAPTDFEVGYFFTPTTSGESKVVGVIGSSPIAVSAVSEHPEEALKLAKFLAFDPQTVGMTADARGFYPNVKLTAGEVPMNLTPLGEEIREGIDAVTVFAPAYYAAGRCGQPPGFEDIALKGFAETLLTADQVDIPAELAKLDAFWDQAQADLGDAAP
jgi:ABC-type glycerol-3-phosphate transport system substrate-binding protein